MKQNRRRWWTTLVTALAALIVLVATLSVLFRVAVNAVPGYRAKLEQFVAISVGHPARIGAMALTWRGLRPTLDLRDIALLDASGQPLLAARRLRLGIDLGRLIAGGRTPDRVDISGLQLDAEVSAAGQWSLRGFDPAANSGGPAPMLRDLARFEDIRLQDCVLLLHDARLGALAETPPLTFRLASATIHRRAEHYQARAQLDPPAELARRVTLSAAFDGAAEEPSSWRGEGQLHVEQIVGWPWLAPALAPGVALTFDRTGLDLGGALEAGHLRRVTLDAQAESVIARQSGKPLAQIAGLHAQAVAQIGDDGAWQLDIQQFVLRGARGSWNPGKTFALRATAAEGGALRLHADRLRLDDLAPWLALVRALPPALARLRDLRGDAETPDLTLTPQDLDDRGPAQPHYALSARLKGFGLAADATQTGFAGMDGTVEADSSGGRLKLADTELTLTMPELFERAVPIESLSGDLAWRRIGADWRLDVSSLTLKTLASQATGDGSLLLPADPSALPQLGLHLRLQSADAAALKPLMPTDWGTGTRAWLNRALIHARVATAVLKIDAPMTPRTVEGHTTMPWQLDLEAVDGELAFAQEWPTAQALHVQLHFHDRGLDVEVDRGELGGTRIERITANIADLHRSDLVLDGSVGGDARDFYKVLRDSPMKARLASLLERTEAAGPTRADLHLRVPLTGDNPDAQASGSVRFDDAQLSVRGLDEPVRAVRGNVVFDRAGVRAEALAGRLYDTAITARIEADAAALDGVLLGEFTLAPGGDQGIAGAFVPMWLRQGLSGSALFRLRLPFSGIDSGHLLVTSQLLGVTSALPPPLTKTPEETLPVSLAIGGDATPPLRVQITVGDALRAALRFATVDAVLHTRGVEVRLGEGEMPRADGEGLALVGAPTRLDLGSWIAFLGAAEIGAATLPFLGADLTPARLDYGKLMLGRTHLVVKAAAGGMSVQLDGAANGQIDWQSAHGGRINARLQSLTLEALPTLPAQPAEAGKESVGESAGESVFDPKAAPLLDLDCAALTLGEVGLGHLTLLTSRVADGQRIERLNLTGGKLDVDAHGAWQRSGGDAAASSADLTFEIASTNIAGVLKALGYEPNLRAEDARFSGHLNWSPSPAGLEFALAKGDVNLDVKRGGLQAVQPGAGRVLGLINLYALPRRLVLDFRDVTSSGLAFDKLSGDFTLADGNANTSNVQIAGPSVKIQMSGRIGLAARDYDQRVTVYPDISTGITLGATLLGGPIGGGIALVAQQLFNKPFNRLAKFSYRVTGSWDNPEVVKGAEGATPLAPPTAPNNGVDHG